MSKHHAMLSYWRDTSQPSNVKTVTFADDREATVAANINRALNRFMLSKGDDLDDTDDDAEGDDEL